MFERRSNRWSVVGDRTEGDRDEGSKRRGGGSGGGGGSSGDRKRAEDSAREDVLGQHPALPGSSSMSDAFQARCQMLFITAVVRVRSSCLSRVCSIPLSDTIQPRCQMLCEVRSEGRT
eukprot:2921454-Rhodomonas_salina.1